MAAGSVEWYQKKAYIKYSTMPSILNWQQSVRTQKRGYDNLPLWQLALPSPNPPYCYISPTLQNICNTATHTFFFGRWKSSIYIVLSSLSVLGGGYLCYRIIQFESTHTVTPRSLVRNIWVHLSLQAVCLQLHTIAHTLGASTNLQFCTC